MRSFAVIAGFAAAANAYAYGYPEAQNTTSAAVPEYPAESASVSEYSAYPVESTKAPEPYTTTEVVTGLTTVCPEPTTATFGTKTYTITTSTTLIDDDCEYSTTYEVKPTPSAEKPKDTPAPSVEKPTHDAPPAYTTAPPAPYPSTNG